MPETDRTKKLVYFDLSKDTDRVITPNNLFDISEYFPFLTSESQKSKVISA